MKRGVGLLFLPGEEDRHMDLFSPSYLVSNYPWAPTLCQPLFKFWGYSDEQERQSPCLHGGDFLVDLFGQSIACHHAFFLVSEGLMLLTLSWACRSFSQPLLSWEGSVECGVRAGLGSPRVNKGLIMKRQGKRRKENGLHVRIRPSLAEMVSWPQKVTLPSKQRSSHSARDYSTLCI